MSEAADILHDRPGIFPLEWETLFTAVLSDALDALGRRHQAMSPRIRPLDDTLKLCGRARTGLYTEVDSVAEGENPYELEIAIVDDLKPGDVVVFACGGSTRIAPWGSLLSTACRARGGIGCITDGYVRDVTQIRAMGLPVFHGGIAPLDSKGRGHVTAIDVPIVCDGVEVSPGDLIFGDADGVVVIPKKLEAQVLSIAFDKINGENHSLRELLDGSYLRDVYAKYGVL
ncbi:MAG: RraA family protein [Alphaproteobacteria bacterium]|nr:RraA family protein [Alphaproteobacteria bacterium]